MTVLGRSILDFDALLGMDSSRDFFLKAENIEGMFSEQKRLATRLTTFYFLSFILSIVVFIGPLPDSASLSVFGMSAPLHIIPQQIVAVILATCFSTYGTTFVSYLLLSRATTKILEMENGEGWHFVAARYDATSLWASVFTPKSTGYISPISHYIIAISILIVAYLTIMSHIIVINTSVFFALISAIDSGEWWLIALALLSVVITSVTTASLLLMALLKLPYTFRSAPWRGFD